MKNIRTSGKKFSLKLKNDEKNFETAIDLLMRDIVGANIYNNLLKNLSKDLNGNQELRNESNTFWFLIIQSLKDSRMIRMCRIFDTEKSSISIFNLLSAIQYHKHFFNKEKFKKRLRENPFVDSLANINREINQEELENEIKRIKEDETIKKIIMVRHNFIAHKSLKSGLNEFKKLKIIQIEFEEIDELLTFCADTINKYLSLFKAGTWLTNIIGHDDYRGIIKFFNIGIKKFENDIQKEIKRYGVNDKGQKKID